MPSFDFHPVAHVAHAALLAHTAATVHHTASHQSPITYLQAIIIGVLQGVTELFPISSLGHAVVFPALFGWHTLAASQSRPESFWLAFVVGLHVGTAVALVIYFRRDWVQIVGSLAHSARTRSITTPTERLGWLLIVATIPAAITGLLLEHPLRVIFSKPAAASAFLIVNGFILIAGELARRRAVDRESKGHRPPRELATLDFKEAGLIGVAQIGALFAGVSRSGITIVAGLFRGLDHSDAARFSFLLATPIIFAAGVYKLPDLLGPLGNGIRGQALAGCVAAGLAAYFSVSFLTRWFKTRTLWPFAAYCIIAGSLLLIRFA